LRLAGRPEPQSINAMSIAASSSPPPSLSAGSALSLAELAPNRMTTITRLVQAQGEEGKTGVLQRLAELGFIAGETVCVLRRGPGGREPIAVQVGDTVFALRRHEAGCIEVKTPA
jgi:ferrous iron transport protein A